jgi:hypothetical protein
MVTIKDGKSNVTLKVCEWTCPIKDCGKKISSLYPKQLEFLAKQHSLTHEK